MGRSTKWQWSAMKTNEILSYTTLGSTIHQSSLSSLMKTPLIGQQPFMAKLGLSQGAKPIGRCFLFEGKGLWPDNYIIPFTQLYATGTHCYMQYPSLESCPARLSKAHSPHHSSKGFFKAFSMKFSHTQAPTQSYSWIMLKFTDHHKSVG